MEKQKECGPPAVWDIESKLIFCDICIREINLGNRHTTHFNKMGWRNIMNSFNEHTGRTYDCIQLKNKWDQLKQDYILWKDLMRGETSFAWNPIKCTIDASDEWWNDKLQVEPAAKKFRFNGITPELQQKLDIMFSCIVATGDHVWVPNSGILPPELTYDPRNSSEETDFQDDDTQIEMSIEEDATFKTFSAKSLSTRPFVNRRKRVKTVRSGGRQLFLNHIEELVNAARSISSAIVSSIAQRRSVTILDALNEINAIPEIYDDLEFYYFAINFLQDKNSREIFMAIPMERKVWWLRRQFNRSFK
ncbi:L10-interacting MYB domain-containing protein-like [Dendrobium catenatum]|uniref:Myb/SANT-like domain-containing protein n=1 Tax=Dendrobium catenatum TaxID=906689 RepID=A0A2I0W585_9ASPA|nr:L10-interacting MYB domain-containing protein-like [Dendrobium catenatum]PKU70818.1 Uncharacterized protein MA16_Dca010798 [Dendrobium catenatum]